MKNGDKIQITLYGHPETVTVLAIHPFGVSGLWGYQKRS